MRLPSKHTKEKRVRVQIREIDDSGKYKNGAKSENFIVLDCTAKELNEFIIKKLKDEKD